MPARRSEHSDERYVIDLCDEALQQVSQRQHRFDFLLGDPGKRGPVRLPVDAFYAALKLVVEFHERQHSEAVPHFDKPDKITVSGVPRSEQRRRYDQRRRELLPKMGFTLIELQYDQFSHRTNRRLKRIPHEDHAIIHQAPILFTLRSEWRR